MTRKQVEGILQKHWLTKSGAELSALTGYSVSQCRRIARTLGLPSKHANDNRQIVAKSIEEQDSSLKTKKLNDFLSFLLKAKTEKELSKKFPDYEELLKENYAGYTLFRQRNVYNELVYVLLPFLKDKQMVILPKKYDFHLGKSEEGIDQPYILCQLPDFKGTIKIALLFDVHYGNHSHKHEKFLAYLNWIKENDDVYAILGGDLMENALDDGRGMTYDQTQNPQTQFEDMAQFLAPIAHKILCSTTGNHEDRTYKKTGIDVMRLLAERLKVPYFSGPIWCSITANTFKWNLYIQHGFGNSQTKGGKMNSANRPKKFTGLIHFFISGHVHDRVCESETLITDDPINCRLVYLDQWTIIAPAFLGWEDTYAYRAGYPPPARGGVAIELEDNGEYRGSLT